MSSKKLDKEKLPDGWVSCTSKSNPGRKYYFNKKTGKSLWTKPQATAQSNKNMEEKEHLKLEKKLSDIPHRCTKRKIDGTGGCSSTKKQKQDKEMTIESSNHDRSDHLKKKETQKSVIEQRADASTAAPKPFQSKCHASTSQSRDKKKIVKNLANARLQNLRLKLNKEIEEEKNYSSSKKRSSNEQTKSAGKIPNDTRLNPSPTNDSLHSIHATSQFLKANKIISSMKAQLTDKYCNNDKQKKTFADIEKVISNQTPECPFSKRPVTPPQFLEASKLVASIKLKLGYKINRPKDEDFQGKDMNSGNSLNSKQLDGSHLEAMEVEDFREPKEMHINPQRDKPDDKEVVLIVDTNIFIHHLDIIKNVLNSHLEGYTEHPNLMVPWRVINELDRLKDINNGNSSLSKRARAAMDYLYKSLPDNSRIKGQTLRDSNCHIYPCEVPDDEILNCALQQVERSKNVLLVSNDKNLCSKAYINSIKYIEINSLKNLLENRPQPAAAELYASFVQITEDIYPLLANILESEMKVKYDNLWHHVIEKPPPWTLYDVLHCILKHWCAVFNEVFPRIESLIGDMKNTLRNLLNKKSETITKFEVSTFKELCLDVAKRCQIIPEYMEMAKACVERLSRDRASEVEEKTDSVVDAFESLWTICSSYCAKLASSAGVVHSLEDSIPAIESVESLIAKWDIFSTNISAISKNMQRVLGNEESDINTTEEVLGDLEKALTQALSSISLDKTISRNELRIFSKKCRNMLQEASGKFSQLSELLLVCKDNLSHGLV